VDGFLNMLVAVRDAGVGRMVYASSISMYGDPPALPREEGAVGRPRSPRAAGKAMNETYGVSGRVHGTPVIGLRCFNLFGRRQSPDGRTRP
jgi:UDP-N-acetylglucosamine 4-epimerase